MSELGRQRTEHLLFAGVVLALSALVLGFAWETNESQQRSETQVENRFRERIELAAGYAGSLLSEMRVGDAGAVRDVPGGSPLEGFLASTASLNGRELHLVDGAGDVVASTRVDPGGQFDQLMPTLAGAPLGQTTLDHRGEEHFVVTESLTGRAAWRLVAAAPRAELIAPVTHSTRMQWALVAGTAAMAVALIGLIAWIARQRDRLRAASRTDALTGLANRGRADEVMARSAPSSQRSGTAWAVAMIDIDHFKSVNDRLGHAGGDRVLRQVAAVLDRESRASDLCARWGGEEFLVVMDDTDDDAAAIAGERFRAAIAESTAGGDEPLTASVGVAAAVGGDADALLHRADDALYAAKHAGRNRVVAAPSQIPGRGLRRVS